MAALLKDTLAPVFPSPVSSRRALEAVQFCLGVGQALKKKPLDLLRMFLSIYQWSYL